STDHSLCTFCNLSAQVCDYYTRTDYRCFCRTNPIYFLCTLYLFILCVYICTIGTCHLASRGLAIQARCFGLCWGYGGPHVCWINRFGFCNIFEKRKRYA